MYKGYKNYCGETRAPKMGPKLGSAIKRPVGGSGIPEVLSLHKRGGQPKCRKRERHGFGGDVGNFFRNTLPGAARSAGDAISGAARTAGDAIYNSPGAQDIRGAAGKVNDYFSHKKGGRARHAMGGASFHKVSDLHKRVAQLEKHMFGGAVGKGFAPKEERGYKVAVKPRANVRSMNNE